MRNPVESSGLAKKSSLSALSSVAQGTGRLACGIIVARCLLPAGMGHYVYLIWLIQLAHMVVSFGLQRTLARYLAEIFINEGDDTRMRICAWIFRRYSALTLCGTIIVIFLVSRLDDPFFSRFFPLIAAILFCVHSLGVFYLSFLTGRQLFGRMARINIVASIMQVAGVFSGACFWGLEGALCGYALGPLLPALGSLPLFGIAAKAMKPRTDICGRMLKFSLHVWVATILSSFTWNRMELVFLEHFRPIEEVGMFSVGLSLAAFVVTTPMMFCGALMPHFAELWGGAKQRDIHRTYIDATRIVALFLFPLCFGGAAILPIVIPLVYGAEFQPAVLPSTILVLGGILSFSAVSSAMTYGIEKSGFVMTLSIAGAILSVLAYIVLIPAFGMVGAAIARIAVQSILIILTLVYIVRRLRCPFPFRVMARTFASAAICGLCALLIAILLPDIYGLFIAVPAGGLVYLIGIRYFHVLGRDDVRSVCGLFGWLPASGLNMVRNTITWLAGGK